MENYLRFQSWKESDATLDTDSPSDADDIDEEHVAVLEYPVYINCPDRAPGPHHLSSHTVFKLGLGVNLHSLNFQHLTAITR